MAAAPVGARLGRGHFVHGRPIVKRLDAPFLQKVCRASGEGAAASSGLAID